MGRKKYIFGISMADSLRAWTTILNVMSIISSHLLFLFFFLYIPTNSSPTLYPNQVNYRRLGPDLDALESK
jgi:hypothetical protein